MIVTTELRWCGECATETAFERFDCADHAADCVECVCTRCGHGFELAPPVPGTGAPVVRRARREAAA
jgi:hypothetical protein